MWNKTYHVGNKKVKLLLFIDDMIIYLEHPKESFKETTKINNELGKFPNINSIFMLAINNKNKILKIQLII